MVPGINWATPRAPLLLTALCLPRLSASTSASNNPGGIPAAKPGTSASPPSANATIPPPAYSPTLSAGIVVSPPSAAIMSGGAGGAPSCGGLRSVGSGFIGPEASVGIPRTSCATVLCGGLAFCCSIRWIIMPAIIAFCGSSKPNCTMRPRSALEYLVANAWISWICLCMIYPCDNLFAATCASPPGTDPPSAPNNPAFCAPR